MPLVDVGLLVLAALVAFLIAGAMAPIEALGWWAGWFGPPRETETPAAHAAGEDEAPDAPADRYVVFLSGIHTVSGRTFSRREQSFLEALQERLEGVPVLEVFPYSVTDRPLTGQRLLAWFWRWALSMKLSRRALAGVAGTVINLRNVFQVAVSADNRYGPIYNEGSADLIAAALRRAGFPPPRRRKGDTRPPGERPTVVLIGYSGGGQIALGAAGPLRRMLDAEVTVVSLGGVMSADPALRELERVWHLVGRRDLVQRLGNVVFPGRWPLLRYSRWYGARQRGVVRIVDMGPPDHTGRHGYLDSGETLPDGRSYLEQTVDVVSAIVRDEDPRRFASGEREVAPEAA